MIKVLFVCDYFPPFIIGGGEISAFWQAKKLIQKGIKIVVLSPRYKDNLKIQEQKFKRYWYYLPWLIKNGTPIFYVNPIFWFYLFLAIIKVIKKEKINLIHCQGKYSAPSAILAKFFLKIPVILSLRDYQGICNHSFCLWKEKKSCNFISFFRKDFLFYFNHYLKEKNPFSFLVTLIISYFGRLNTFILSFFMKKADKYICVSNYVKEVYVKNGYESNKMITIYNFPPVLKKKTIKIPLKIKEKINKYKYKIFYAGKISLGKGGGLLIEAAKEIIKKRKDVVFVFAGEIHFPIRKIKHRQLVFLGRLENNLVLKIMRVMDLVCVPSLWPEPLSRVTLEAFWLKKPVLSSKVGGQKEIIDESVGWLFRPSKNDLILKLNDVLKNKKEIGTKGKEAYKKLILMENQQLGKLIDLYQQCL